MVNVRKYVLFIIVILFIFAAMMGCTSSEYIDENPDIYSTTIANKGDSVRADAQTDTFSFHPIVVPHVFEILPYPSGPYAIEKFKVLPNMSFFDPWAQEWIKLSDLYQHNEHKAFLLVSSAGWCGPCLKEAAALIELYEKYNPDGLEIIYTLGNTNIPGDVPFNRDYEDPNSIAYKSDLLFMENWIAMTEEEAKKKLNYKMYADLNREIAAYMPNHAWPLSILVTTKDMGVRLVEEGYWSALMNNKITLVLYSDVPNIPFE